MNPCTRSSRPDDHSPPILLWGWSGSRSGPFAHPHLSQPLACFTPPRWPTPQAWEGPWYPVGRPARVGRDLTRVPGAPGSPEGRIILFGGRALDTTGRPLTGAFVDMWQVNAFGRYYHPDPQGDLPLDPAFRGFGDDETDAAGWFWFRTVEPVGYERSGRVSGRFPPHVHMKLRAEGCVPLSAQVDFLPAPGTTSPRGGQVNRPGPDTAQWAATGSQPPAPVPPDLLDGPPPPVAVVTLILQPSKR